jgi:hypothetical protein
VNERDLADDRLKRAFQGLADGADADCSAEDLDQVRRALAGELPAADRRALIDRLAAEPALADAWRVAAGLQELWPSAPPAPPRRVVVWPRSWMAAAAALLLIVAGGVTVLQRWPSEGNGVFRTSDQYVVESLVPDDAALPRDAFRLRWTPGPAESRYQVRVTTDDLRVLATAPDLAAPQLTVERDRLAEVPPGGRVLWQVEVTLPGGARVASRTFTARVE